MTAPIKEPINGITYEEREILGNHASWDKIDNQWKIGYIDSNGKKTSVRAPSSFDATREGGLDAIKFLRNKVNELGIVEIKIRGKSSLQQQSPQHHKSSTQQTRNFQEQPKVTDQKNLDIGFRKFGDLFPPFG